jgi:hypothetical protein
MNEGTSDIFGTLVEFFANNPKDNPDYDIGELININGDGSPLRYMYDPHKDGASDNCWTSRTPSKDPHYSSGVANHFFYLLAVGSANSLGFPVSPTCNGSAVTGIGNEKAGKIWYKALSTYMVSSETYARARQDSLKAASDLYGQCGTEYQAVQAAWSAVSVSGSDASCGGGTPPPTGTYFENTANVNIPDAGPAVESPITVSGVSGNAPTALKVGVDIKHTYRGDLVVDLVAPDGSTYSLKNSSSSDGAADVAASYTVNAYSEVANGTWKLRVRDAYAQDIGYIDAWNLTF